MHAYMLGLGAASVIAVLPGCGGGGDLMSLAITSGQYGSLHFTATTRAAYHKGDHVTVTLAVQNPGAQPVTYDYATCDPFIAIVRQGSQEVATFPGCHGCAGGTSHGSFGSGETILFTMTWNQKIGKECGLPQDAVAPGTYNIQARLDVGDINGDHNLPPEGVGAAPLTINIR